MSRRNVSGKDIRSRIKHSNTNLGSGVELSRTATTSASQAALQAGYATSVGNGIGGNSYIPDAGPSVPNQRSYQDQYQYDQPVSGAGGYNQYQPPVSQQQQHQLGAGPSFVSLTPSDSISNFEGRQGSRHQQQPYHHDQSHFQQQQQQAASGNLFPRPASPTAGSTASFARQMHDTTGGGTDGSITPPAQPSANANLPGRPQRSNRRPLGRPGSANSNGPGTAGPPGPSPLGYDPYGGTTDSAGSYQYHRGPTPDVSVIPPPRDPSYPPNNGTSSGDRHARSARLMAQVNDLDGNSNPNRMSTGSEDESLEDAYGGLSPIEGPTRSPFAETDRNPFDGASPHLGSLSKDRNPAALGSVLSALSQAGRKGQGRRIMRGMTAEEESRRRKVERRMDEARNVEFRDLRHYQTAADSEVGGVGRIGAVLRKVKTEWAVLTEDDFNSVALALSLLDESSLGSNRGQFQATKSLIEEALQGTVDDHYESFATAITLHNSVLGSLTSVQSSVSSSRRRLRDARDALGSKRADLVQLWHRQQSVKEALRLLNTVEQLKGVPDRLESLMSDKHFLSAVNLLVRALKVIEKPEMQEIGAISDLRNYLRSQEGHMLEILLEEIHNHLYLKSIYCDRRWRGYQPGEETLPDVKWGKGFDETQDTDTASAPDTPQLSGGRRPRNLRDVMPVKLSHYLDTLPSRRVGDVSYSTHHDLGDLEEEAGGSRTPVSGGSAMRRTGSATSNADDNGVDTGADATAAAEFDENPESDSFQYIEMLLEALARLGKMGMAIDIIHQRLPLEIHSLVESTIREVENRAEPLRRSAGLSTIRPESILLASSSALAKTFGEDSGSSRRSSHGHANGLIRSASTSNVVHAHNSRPLSTLLRLSATESSQVVTDGEIMRDLFWTLFSKLDAVLQGHRVIHEVARQISQRTGFKEGASAANGSNGRFAEKLRGRLVGGERLLEVWGPIQMEVRSLLHEHLLDDTQSPSSRRNNMISINEVLRQGRFERDRSKKLFNLSHQAGRGGGASVRAGGSASGNANTVANKREMTLIKRHEDSLNSALRAFVPGLVNAAETAGGVLGVSTMDGLSAQQREQQILASATAGSDGSSRYTTSMIASSHRLLVKPDAFNISVLFQPALAFVDRVRVIMPSEAAGETSKGFSAFLDEFVQDVFLPQLEDKVQTLFQSAVGGADAFAEDPASRGVSQKPIVKSAANVVVFIDSLYSMLRTTPFHRESYSRLIIQTIVQYYARCYERYKDLVAMMDAGAGAGGPSNGGQAQSMLSARWAQHPQLADVLAELVDSETDPLRKMELLDEESNLEVVLSARLYGGSVSLEDLITSRKKLLALGHLQHSLRWFLKHISRLKATDESLPVSSRPTARLSLVEGINGKGETHGSSDDLKLPLSADMAARYETLPRTFLHLSNTILFTLRMEMRARTIHHLDLSISEGNYLVEESNAEPDPHVVDLNAELANLDDILADSVTSEDHRFLFEGLDGLMDSILISAVKKMRAINRPGVSKMIRNILALQQNLKNIVISDMGGFTVKSNGNASDGLQNGSSGSTAAGAVNFEHSRRFWDLLSRSPSEMLDAVKRDTKRGNGQGQVKQRRRYGFDEVKSALNLMLGLDNSPPPPPPTSAGSQSQPSSAATTTTASAISTSSSSRAVGPSVPSLRAGTVDAKEGTGSRQKLNEYLIELHQVLDEDDDE